MGQTLTHGIYLPDEGERNCYDGLAANWQILDGSVGTIAAHTAALAGKAPLVHTHTKSDVTDLFNSANTWTKNNTFSADCIVYNSDSSGSTAGLKLRNSKAEVLSTGNTSSDQSMTFRDKNDVAISYIKGAVQSNIVAIKIGAYAKDPSNNTVNAELQLLAFTNGNKAVIPSTTNAYDFGTSSYKWKTLNGINPGALSIFNPSATQDPIDVQNTWVTDGSAWNTLNVSNMGDGWICLTYILCGANDYILVRFGSTSAAYPSMLFPAIMLADSKYYLYVLTPVAKAMGNIYLEIKLDSNAALAAHDFIPAYGTV